MATSKLEKKLEKIDDYESLNRVLLDTISNIIDRKVTIEEAAVISVVADKVVKNNLTKIMYEKARGTAAKIDFFEPHIRKLQ